MINLWFIILFVLIENGVKDICIISTSKHIDQYKKLLGFWRKFGDFIKIQNTEKTRGIAQTFLLTTEVLLRMVLYA